MGNYGVAEYGDAGDYYGNVIASGLSGAVEWIFLVDWDGDSTFAYNEGAYLIDLWTTRGERYLIDKGGTEFVPIHPGEGTATLTNKNSRFDPDYAAGPLYEKILPGRKFRLMVKDLGTGTTYPVMAGFIYDIPPVTERDTIQLQLRDSASLLDNEVSINILYRNSITEAMTQLLSAVEWPTVFGTALDTESQQITAFTVDKINALDTFINLGAACLGQVFADNEGRLIFYARGQASMPSVAIDQAQVEKQIRRSQPWENLRNIIHVTANKKVKARESPIWQNSGPIQVNGSSSNTIWVQYRDAIDVRVYSFTANASVNGTGVDLTSSVTYDLDIFPSSLKITFTNASSSTAYVTEMVVLGRPIIDQPIRKTVQNALSTATYGKMVFSLDNPWLQDLSHATEFATMISNFLDEPQRTIQIGIDQRPDLQYSFDLMDKIPFTSDKLDIDATYFVGLIEHKWMEATGQAVKTTLVMRPRLTDGTAISNDPEDPDLPYIPEPPYNPGWPIDIPSEQPPINAPGGTCLTDPAAPANGPFNLTGPFPIDLRSNGTRYRDLGVVDGVYMRPSNFTNPSQIAITGNWQAWNTITNTWEGETSSTNWHLTINGAFEATKRVITDQGTGTRVLDIASGGGQMLGSLRFEVDDTSDEFTAGNIIATGTVLGTDGTGDAIGLVIGNYYSIESIAGPYKRRADFLDSYGVSIYDGTQQIDCGYDVQEASYLLGGGLHYDIITPLRYARAFFNATSNIFNVRAWDTSWGDNSGSIGYIVRNAYFEQMHRWYIRGVSLFNVCGKA